MNNLNFSRALAGRLFAAALLQLSAHNALAEVHYVDANSTNATPPYTNWTTAATNIQDAVDAAVQGDEIVVTNGIYSTGGRATVDDYTTNRVVLDKPLNIRSVNGPQVTTIDGGYYEGRCIYMTNGASLSGFTLANGYSFPGGGGAYGGTLNNCTLSGNIGGSIAFGASGGGAKFCTLNNCTLSGNVAYGFVQPCFGGGAAYCTLNNCTLTGNLAIVNAGGGSSSNALGGGAYSCTLNNCTLTGNSASGGAGKGGGAVFCQLNNCTLIGNSADFVGGGAWGCALRNCIVYFNTNGGNGVGTSMNYCCTTPLPTNGVGNITNAPLFVDTASGNLRLQPNSPCINAGNNSYVTNATDLDGNPRISGGTVDIGAYEYQWPQLTIAHSGANVLLIWPTNNAGYDYNGFTLQSTTNLVSPVVWTTNSPAPVVIGGQNTVTNAITGAQQFYRLVQ